MDEKQNGHTLTPPLQRRRNILMNLSVTSVSNQTLYTLITTIIISVGSVLFNTKITTENTKWKPLHAHDCKIIHQNMK
jgi:hypothetical protein